MSLKLYCDLLSQPSRVLYIFLKICNIPFETKLINLGKGEHLTSEYQKIHPFQKVPAIDHNDYNVAIVRYICREFKVPDHWYPKESKSQVKIDEYLEWQHLNTRLFCALYFRLKYLMPIITGQPTNQEKIMKYEKNLNETLDVLENVWLKDTNFLVGSKISIADIFGACEVEQVRITGYNPHEGRPRVASWMKRVANETSPYYQEAHVILNKLVDKEKQKALKSKF
ncbi:Glutathione S-transferase theta-1 [Habropoda laboriosa]|uniref:glutathione transferase n=1 Tax=Habropoda laboriosa TaxID=597456 RepID=A0A0L7QJV0_9HYME|nr:PREDICTED: glutathione S-transferase theta-1-like [Habropoda laboriosa]KOC58898.1 Glutathione S-transferase theta-1 [Habropoda laboriosa]